MTVSDEVIQHLNLSTEITIGDKVKIKKVDLDANEIDLEDYYYLKEFENKIGTICEKNRNGSGVYAYRVAFSEDKFGYFYENDFELEYE